MRLLLFKYLIIGSALLFLSSCYNTNKVYDESYSVEKLYNEALEEANSKNFQNAVEIFDEVERIYPYSKWANDANLLSAYSSFSAKDYDTAIFKLENFISLHPGSKYLEYAYYLKALSYYRQVSVVTKDQHYSIKAKKAFNEVILRFPNTKYAQDSKIKIDFLKNNLAGKELSIGMFYLKKSDYVAAINRFKSILNQYNTTSYVPEALYRLVESYMSLGIEQQACYYTAVLGHNYPFTSWYKYSFNLLNSVNNKTVTKCKI